MVTSVGMKTERIRQLIDLALSCGRSKQSPQTGFVHYCYHTLDEQVQDTIPLYENFLFVLALFRNRTSETVFEAKDILEKLLHFQHSFDELTKGNFPLYIHEYPLCKDRFLGAQLLPVFFWILKHYHHVMGQELKEKVELSAKQLLEYSLRALQEKQPPFQIAIKISASSLSFGEMWKDQRYSEQGKNLLSQLHQESKKSSFNAWGSPSSIADTLTALQMIHQDIQSSVWKHFWNYICQTWHRKICSYVGPGFKEFQKGEESLCTLYDLYLGYFSGEYSYRSFLNLPFLLQAALIHPFEGEMAFFDYPFQAEGVYGEHRWLVKQNDRTAFSMIERLDPPNLQSDKYFHPLKILWGDANKAHSFVCQGGNSSKIQFLLKDDEINLIFELNETIHVEDKDKNREISFYFNNDEGAMVSVKDMPSTTFQLGQEVKIKNAGMIISMIFELVEGNGRFFGHIMKGNRLSQVDLKGSNRFQVYDGQIFLRTVRRFGLCRILAKIKVYFASE